MPDLEPRLVEICFLFFFCFLEQRSLFMHVVAASVRASEMGSEIQALALGVPVHVASQCRLDRFIWVARKSHAGLGCGQRRARGPRAKNKGQNVGEAAPAPRGFNHPLLPPTTRTTHTHAEHTC